MSPSTSPTRRVVVIGGSRGIGAAAVRGFAQDGHDVIFTFAQRHAHAERLIRSLVDAPGKAVARQLDASREEDVRWFFEDEARALEPIDILVLAASGGLEPGRPSSYAWALNGQGPSWIVDCALPRMRRGAVIIYLTSHEAHLFGQKPTYGSYALIAETKNSGEKALHLFRERLDEGGVTLNILSGDIVADSTTAKLLELRDKGLIALLAARAGRLPTTQDMADEVRRLAFQPLQPNFSVSYVWDPTGYLAAPSQQEAPSAGQGR